MLRYSRAREHDWKPVGETKRPAGAWGRSPIRPLEEAAGELLWFAERWVSIRRSRDPVPHTSRELPLYLLLQDDLIALLEAFQDFRLGAVRDADLDGSLLLAAVSLRVHDLDGSFLVFVVDDGAFGDHQDVLVLFEDDLRVRRHGSLEFAGGVVDGDTHFERGDVVFLHAHGRDLGDLAVEGLVFERLHLDARRLADVDLADIRLVHFALHVDLVRVAFGHDESGGGAEDKDGADCVTDLDIARQDDAVDGSDDGGVAQVLLLGLEPGAGLIDLGLVHRKLGLGDALLVDGELVVALRVVECGRRNHAFFRHLLGALVRTL